MSTGEFAVPSLRLRVISAGGDVPKVAVERVAKVHRLGVAKLVAPGAALRDGGAAGGALDEGLAELERRAGGRRGRGIRADIEVQISIPEKRLVVVLLNADRKRGSVGN